LAGLDRPVEGEGQFGMCVRAWETSVNVIVIVMPTPLDQLAQCRDSDDRRRT
jgi:hypothetical protein